MSQTRQLTDLQERWLAALESGEYAQTQGQLFRGGAYCPLGVACVVMGDPQPYGHALIPEQVNELGLRGVDGDFYEPWYVQIDNTLRRDATEHEVQSITELNDMYGWGFEDIAEWIRANPSEVFA